MECQNIRKAVADKMPGWRIVTAFSDGPVESARIVPFRNSGPSWVVELRDGALRAVSY